EDIANNPNKASENNATYNNNTSNAQYENTYNQSQDNTTYAPAQNATSDAGTAQNVEATQAPAPQTTQANAAAQGQQGGGST
ncbi:hypothetical protein NL473_29070, partial [Klebsiella pneumoniae]|nr:hypothetical protein [Klebsiella pneumoniae]MCP6594678.1 hypothetical protein [Klebsiella pneumoniae]